MASSLDGHVAFVSGAAQGMGAAHARRLAALGATVAVNDRLPSVALESLAAEIGGFACAADMSDHDAVIEAFTTVNSRLGDVDILVANHAYMTMADFLEHEAADWWRVVDTNLGGTFSMIQAALPGMRRRGAGRIVIISSEWGQLGWPQATAYAAAKAGLISLTKTLGRELAREHIIVNAIAPGVTDTPQLQVDADAAGADLAEIHRCYAQDIPLGRIGRPEEIAAAVGFLADFGMESIVGQVISVNGGSSRTSS